MARRLQVEIVGDASSLERSFGRAASSASSFGSRVGSAMRSVGRVAVTTAGIAGIGLLTAAVVTGTKEFAESSRVQAQVQSALASTKGVANVTAASIDALADSQLRRTAIDDEATKSSASVLLAFQNVRNEVGKGNDIFNRAEVAIADMATRMNGGLVPSSEQLRAKTVMLGKALEDPTKRYASLARAGVTFTAGQVESIKAMQKSGNLLGAQKVLLAAVEAKFKGAAAAAGDTLPGKLARAREQFSNLSGQLIGFVAPALGKVADNVSSFLGRFDKAKGASEKLQVVWDGLKGAATSIAGALGDAVGSVDWGAVWGKAKGIAAGLAARLKSIDWGDVGRSIGDGIGAAVETAAAEGKGIVGALSNAWQSVDWPSLGMAMGPGIVTALASAFVTATDPAFWAQHWDLALAVMIAAFSKGLGKLVAPLFRAFGRLFGDAALGIVSGIERVSPAVASAVLGLFTKLPGIARTALAALERVVVAVFGKLTGAASFVVKVLGIQAVLDSLARLGRSVAGIVSGIYDSIVSNLEAAWRWAEKWGLKFSRAILVPFSHLPSAAGDWATQLIKKIDGKLAQMRGEDAVRQLKRDLEAGFREAKAKGQTDAQAIATAVKGTSGKWAGAGSALGGAFKGALSGAVNGLAEQVAAKVNAELASAQQQINQRWGIRSPSRVWQTEIGEQLGLGVVHGIVVGLQGGVAAANREVARIEAAIKAQQTRSEDEQNLRAIREAERAVAAARKKGEGVAAAEQQLADARQAKRDTAASRELERAQAHLDRMKSQLERAQAREVALTEQAQARMQAIRDRAAAAWEQVASRVRALFDAETAGYRTEAEQQLDAIDRRRRLEDAAQAVVDAERALAKAREEGDPDAIARAERDAIRAREDQDRIALEDRAAAERKAYDDQRTEQGRQLDAQLAQLGTKLTKQGQTWDAAMKGILAIIGSHTGGFASAGSTIGQAFGAAMLAAVAKAAQEAQDVADAAALNAAKNRPKPEVTPPDQVDRQNARAVVASRNYNVTLTGPVAQPLDEATLANELRKLEQLGG